MPNTANGHVDLICKGKNIDGKYLRAYEQTSWNKDVSVFFQPNAWMDRDVMKRSASKFVKYIGRRHAGKKVLLFCDNLDAHICAEVKDIFAKGNVFVCCLPPRLTDSMQPIDAVYGRSVRNCIGRILDDWLMGFTNGVANIEKWEEGMTAADRHSHVQHRCTSKRGD